MCTILFSWKKVPGYKLVLIANRDEFYERPTALAHWWEDHPEVLAGRDLQAGGTWMGINKNGKFAAITNFRKFPLEGPFETSRGDIVKDFLTTGTSSETYLNKLNEIGFQFDGYNLIFGDSRDFFYHSNRGNPISIEPNTYGLSNHLLDTAWPKVKYGKLKFISQVETGTTMLATSRSITPMASLSVVSIRTSMLEMESEMVPGSMSALVASN